MNSHQSGFHWHKPIHLKRLLLWAPGALWLLCGVAPMCAQDQPFITTHPLGNSNVLCGGFYTLNVSAGGAGPLTYAWSLNGAVLAGATDSSLLLTNIDYTNAGSYTVEVSNSSGKVASEPAYVDVVPSVLTSAALRIWTRVPGELFCLSGEEMQRGLAFNPSSSNLLVVSRWPTNGVHVLNLNHGGYMRSLDMFGVGGVMGVECQVNMVAVADDGVVYVCDLCPDGGTFVIYSWADDTTNFIANLAYAGDPLIGRVGDTLSVAGSGAGTRLFAGSRDSNKVAVFTTDGFNWTPHVVEVKNASPGFAGFGLFATATNEFWGKSPGHLLTKVTFDLERETNGITAHLQAGVGTLGPIGIDAENTLVAGLASSQTPHNLALYDMFQTTTPEDSPLLLDQEWIATENPNPEAFGQVAMDLRGGLIFVLDANNGLIGLKYAPPLRHNVLAGKLVLSWGGPAKLMSAQSATGPYSIMDWVQSPFTNSVEGPVFYRLMWGRYW